MRKLQRLLVKRQGLLWWRAEVAGAMRARRRLKQRRRTAGLAKLRQRLRELLWNLQAGQQRRQGQRRRLLRLLEGRVRAKLKQLQGRPREPRSCLKAEARLMLLRAPGLLLQTLGRRRQMRLRLQGRLQEWQRVRLRRMQGRGRVILVTRRGWLLVLLLWRLVGRLRTQQGRLRTRQ